MNSDHPFKDYVFIILKSVLIHNMEKERKKTKKDY